MICDQCETVAHCLKNGCVPKTTKKDEAMKLALEALARYQVKRQDFDRFADEITALREALAEQPAQQEQTPLIDFGLHELYEFQEATGFDTADEFKAAQQKPVAWMYDQAKYRENDLRGRQWAFNCFSQNKPWVDDMVRKLTPLYTSPPAQRTWVGLTDEEIELLEELYAPPMHPDFVNDADHCFSLIKKVENKLKEKNA